MTLSNTEGQIIRFAEISKVGLARLSPSAIEEPCVKAVQACLVQDVTAGHFPGFRAWYVVEQPVSVSARAEDIISSVPDGYRYANARLHVALSWLADFLSVILPRRSAQRG